MTKYEELKAGIETAQEELMKYGGNDVYAKNLRDALRMAESYYCDPYLTQYTGAAIRYLDAAMAYKRPDKIASEIELAHDRIVRVWDALSVADNRKEAAKKKRGG